MLQQLNLSGRNTEIFWRTPKIFTISIPVGGGPQPAFGEITQHLVAIEKSSETQVRLVGLKYNYNFLVHKIKIIQKITISYIKIYHKKH